MEALRAAGLRVAVVSGLTAGIAGPAALGIPVTDRRCAPGVALIAVHPQALQGGEAGDASDLPGRLTVSGASGATGAPGPSGAPVPGPDGAALARSGLTLVIYMGVSRVQALADTLLAAGMPASRPAAVISAAHTPHQRACRSTLGRLAQDVVEHGLVSPAVLVVGEVAALGDSMADRPWGAAPADGQAPSLAHARQS
jgi:uroporphyrin-III C-methyltransferase